MRFSAFACSIVLALCVVPAGAESVVRYGISLADIPLTTGQPDRGAGAYQFTGNTIYDSAGRLGDGRGGPARQARPRPRDRVEGQRHRQDEVDVHACARVSNSMTAARSRPMP